MHRTTEQLEAGIDHIRQAPADAGPIELMVCRPAAGQREVLTAAQVDLVRGVVGDSWEDRPSRQTPDHTPHPGMQVTLMNARVAALVAGTPGRWALAGDQFYVDLDISEQNLPTGTQLALGSAILEVTEAPHRGCVKFTGHFGLDAHHFVNAPAHLALRLRGVNTRVIASGTVRVGELVTRIA